MDLTPIIAAVIASIASVIGAVLTTRRLRRKDAKDADHATLRDHVELLEAREQVWHEKYDAEVAAHVVTRSERDFARLTGDECQRRLANAYDELDRAPRRRPRARPEPQ